MSTSSSNSAEQPDQNERLPQTAPQASWPQPVDAGPKRISYAITVHAPAHLLWSLLANPHRHHEVDGSGTVKSKVSGPERLEVGDKFSVSMRKYKVPYTMTLVTTQSEPGRIIEWKHPGGHLWRWEFAVDPQRSDHTVVTETFDYSPVRPVVAKGYQLIRATKDNSDGIQASLTRLAGRFL